MRLATNMIVVGGVIAAAVLLKKLVRSRRGADVTPTDERGLGASDLPVPDLAGDELSGTDMTAVATESGIANVDPVPLSQVVGEGIDLDGDITAHQEISDLHDRLPRH
ncbi:MAG TPA: hypothetical protein VFS15_11455 [Kofleriaceae bacterium]|nr:hypothetical protein [Kofleriaceae bacterium]